MLEDEPDLGKEPCFYLWPENVWMWQVFIACRTQWRSGFVGATGLDYAGVQTVFEKKLRIPRRKQDEAWRLLDAMEIGALLGWGEKREEDERQRKSGYRD